MKFYSTNWDPWSLLLLTSTSRILALPCYNKNQITHKKIKNCKAIVDSRLTPRCHILMNSTKHSTFALQLSYVWRLTATFFELLWNIPLGFILADWRVVEIVTLSTKPDVAYTKYCNAVIECIKQLEKFGCVDFELCERTDSQTNRHAVCLFACLSVCLSVCTPARITRRPHGQTYQICYAVFLYSHVSFLPQTRDNRGLDNITDRLLPLLIGIAVQQSTGRVTKAAFRVLTVWPNRAPQVSGHFARCNALIYLPQRN